MEIESLGFDILASIMVGMITLEMTDLFCSKNFVILLTDLIILAGLTFLDIMFGKKEKPRL